MQDEKKCTSNPLPPPTRTGTAMVHATPSTRSSSASAGPARTSRWRRWRPNPAARGSWSRERRRPREASIPARSAGAGTSTAPGKIRRRTSPRRASGSVSRRICTRPRWRSAPAARCSRWVASPRRPRGDRDPRAGRPAGPSSFGRQDPRGLLQVPQQDRSRRRPGSASRGLERASHHHRRDRPLCPNLSGQSGDAPLSRGSRRVSESLEALAQSAKTRLVHRAHRGGARLRPGGGNDSAPDPPSREPRALNPHSELSRLVPGTAERGALAWVDDRPDDWGLLPLKFAAHINPNTRSRLRV